MHRTKKEAQISKLAENTHTQAQHCSTQLTVIRQLALLT